MIRASPPVLVNSNATPGLLCLTREKWLHTNTPSRYKLCQSSRHSHICLGIEGLCSGQFYTYPNKVNFDYGLIGRHGSVRRRGRTLARTLRGGWCGALGLQCTATFHEVVSASPVLDAVIKWSATGGDALRPP